MGVSSLSKENGGVVRVYEAMSNGIELLKCALICAFPAQGLHSTYWCE